METYEKTNNPRRAKVVIAALVILAIVNGVTLYFLFSEKHEKTEVIAQKNDLEQDFHNVSDSLDAESLRLGLMKGKNEDMDRIITEKQANIEQQKQELAEAYDKNTLTQAELDRARGTIVQYQKSVAQLQQQVKEYAEQNTQLTQHNQELAGNLDCEMQTNTELASTNQVLTKKVNAGSVLQIPKLTVEAVKRKNNGTEVAVTKAKAAENLKITFETGVNKVIDPGTIPLYVRIINPRGETIAVKEQGSGIIPETENGKPVQYTKKASVHYNQSNKKVVVYWSRYIDATGTYRVELYQNGKVIGKGAVSLS